MYLPGLPGFQEQEQEQGQEQEPTLGRSRIETLTRKHVRATKTRPKQYKFNSGDIDDRITWIEYEVNIGKRNPGVRQIAADVLKGTPPKDWKNSAKLLFEWTRTNIRYTLDPHNVELFQSAERSVQVGIGDCDDQSIVLASLLQCVGIPVILRVIGLKGQRVFQHIYVMAGYPPHDPKNWIALDASRSEAAGWELPENERGLLKNYVVDDYDPEYDPDE